MDLQAPRRREAHLSRGRRHLRRVRPRAGGAALARAARSHRRANVSRRGPRTVVDGARRDRARLVRPAAARRLRLRPRGAARAAARRDDAPDDPAVRPRARRRAAASGDWRPRRIVRRGRIVRHGHGRRALGLRQRASRPRGRDRRVQHRRRAGVERRLRRVPRRRRLGRAAALVGAGRRRVGALSLRARRAGTAQRARAARLLGGGGRVRPVGGEAAADGSRVGAGREAGRAPRRGLGLGVDVVGLRRLSGLPGVPVRGVLRGVLRPRVQGAARGLLGYEPDRGSGHVPQLGLPPSAGRSLPASAARATFERRSALRDAAGRRLPHSRGPPGRLARRRPPGPHVDAERAAAEVVLRRARLDALRGDHEAARVLPHRARAHHPRRARGRRRAADRREHARGARLGIVGEDPAPARRDGRGRLPQALRPLRRL